MIKLIIAFIFTSTVLLAPSCAQQSKQKSKTSNHKTTMKDKITKSDSEWKKELTENEYKVLRQKGTERAFSNEFWDNKEEGTYLCAACGNPVFSSDSKFESGTGWPSFYEPINESAVETESDRSLGMLRTEVHCQRCGGHLGHVFDDGPQPTGMRYCVNSVAMDFKKKEDIQ